MSSFSKVKGKTKTLVDIRPMLKYDPLPPRLKKCGSVYTDKPTTQPINRLEIPIYLLETRFA